MTGVLDWSSKAYRFVSTLVPIFAGMVFPTPALTQNLDIFIAPAEQFIDGPALPWNLEALGSATQFEGTGSSFVIPAPDGSMSIAIDPPIVGLEYSYRAARDSALAGIIMGNFDPSAFAALKEQEVFAQSMRNYYYAGNAIDINRIQSLDPSSTFNAPIYNAETDVFNIYGFSELSPEQFTALLPEQLNSLTIQENLEFRGLLARRENLSIVEGQRFQYLFYRGIGIPIVKPPMVIPIVKPPIIAPGEVIPDRITIGPAPIIRTYPYNCPNANSAKILPAACPFILAKHPESEVCKCD